MEPRYLNLKGLGCYALVYENLWHRRFFLTAEQLALDEVVPRRCDQHTLHANNSLLYRTISLVCSTLGLLYSAVSPDTRLQWLVGSSYT